jgi:hypothetical protein
MKAAGNDSMGLKRTINRHHEQFHAHKLDGLNKMNKFKGRSHLPNYRRENTFGRVCRKYIDSGFAEWLK